MFVLKALAVLMKQQIQIHEWKHKMFQTYFSQHFCLKNQTAITSLWYKLHCICVSEVKQRFEIEAHF